jgi:hypothetical protein
MDPAFERMTRALHRSYDELLHEPLPERWIGLIKRLNAEERIGAEAPVANPFRMAFSTPERPGPVTVSQR